MTTFNLIDSPWIPVRWLPTATDTPPRVSLATAFSQGSHIADLDCSPPERIALMRLLICITHAALGVPEDANEWDDFGSDLDTAIPNYLRQPEIHPHFNLLGDGPRFLQEELPSTTEPVPNSKLFPQLATGGNPTLLDHSGMSDSRLFNAHDIALALLTFQNFYPSYGRGYKGSGPCAERNAIHTLFLGKNLTQTILSNLVDENSIEPMPIGIPIWKCMSPSELKESTTTLLGRLVPRHRSVKLTDDLTHFYHRAKSLEYPGWEGFREPSVTTILNAKNVRSLLPARLDRSLWRDLHSLTALRVGMTGNDFNEHSAPVLRSQEERLRSGKAKLWTGTLIDSGQAKFLDAIESTFTVNHALFTPAGHNIYSSGTDHAETVSKKLYGAIKTYGSSLSNEKPPIEEGQKHFWHVLDQTHRTLIALAGDPESTRGKPAIGSPGAEDEWTKAVRQAALDAYQTVCPATSPRQIQAYAAGIKPLMRALYPTAKKATKKAAEIATSTTQPELNL
ncbi:type I-E CRISPR-associated protein Cse1/CasA [Verrucomicrobiaceae bacterium 227]